MYILNREIFIPEERGETSWLSNRRVSYNLRVLESDRLLSFCPMASEGSRDELTGKEEDTREKEGQENHLSKRWVSAFILFVFSPFFSLLH